MDAFLSGLSTLQPAVQPVSHGRTDIHHMFVFNDKLGLFDYSVVYLWDGSSQLVQS